MRQPSSRRAFLQTAGLGAAAAGVAAVSPGLLAGSAQAATLPSAAGPAYEGAVTAYVRDHRTGEVAVMFGEREIVVRDRALARRLAAIAGSSVRT